MSKISPLRSKTGVMYRSPCGVFHGIPGFSSSKSLMIWVWHDESQGGTPSNTYDYSDDSYDLVSLGSGVFQLQDEGTPQAPPAWVIAETDICFLTYNGTKYRIDYESSNTMYIFTTGITPPGSGSTTNYSIDLYDGSYDGSDDGYYEDSDLFAADLAAMQNALRYVNYDVVAVNEITARMQPAGTATYYNDGFAYWHDGSGMPSEISTQIDINPWPYGSAADVYTNTLYPEYSNSMTRLGSPAVADTIIYYVSSRSVSSWNSIAGSSYYTHAFMQSGGPYNLMAAQMTALGHTKYGYSSLSPVYVGSDPTRHDWDVDYFDGVVAFNTFYTFSNERWMNAIAEAALHFKANYAD